MVTAHDETPTVAEQIAQAIEADRMRLTASAGTPERAWQAGHNKGLSDAAYIARSFATPAQPAALAEDGWRLLNDALADLIEARQDTLAGQEMANLLKRAIDTFRVRTLTAAPAQPAVPVATDLSALIVDISNMIDGTYPAGLDAESRRWRRCAKVAEEAGEVIEALFGVAGENPRKGTTHTLIDLRDELLDVATAALGAVAHLSGPVANDPVAALTSHVRSRHERLRTVLADEGGKS